MFLTEKLKKIKIHKEYFKFNTLENIKILILENLYIFDYKEYIISKMREL